MGLGFTWLQCVLILKPCCGHETGGDVAGVTYQQLILFYTDNQIVE